MRKILSISVKKCYYLQRILNKACVSPWIRCCMYNILYEILMIWEFKVSTKNFKNIYIFDNAKNSLCGTNPYLSGLWKQYQRNRHGISIINPPKYVTSATYMYRYHSFSPVQAPMLHCKKSAFECSQFHTIHETAVLNVLRELRMTRFYSTTTNIEQS